MNDTTTVLLVSLVSAVNIDLLVAFCFLLPSPSFFLIGN